MRVRIKYFIIFQLSNKTKIQFLCIYVINYENAADILDEYLLFYWTDQYVSIGGTACGFSFYNNDIDLRTDRECKLAGSAGKADVNLRYLWQRAISHIIVAAT